MEQPMSIKPISTSLELYIELNLHELVDDYHKDAIYHVEEEFHLFDPKHQKKILEILRATHSDVINYLDLNIEDFEKKFKYPEDV